MRTRTLLALALSAVLLVPLGAGAQPNNNGNGKGGQPTYQVSGGGQVLVSASGNGPGTTVGFVAQGQGPGGDQNARGQFQVVDRRDSPGPGQGNGVKFHGRVECINPDVTFVVKDDDGETEQTFEGVRFGGTGDERGGPGGRGESKPFQVDVFKPANDDDTVFIVFRYNDDVPEDQCAAGDEEEEIDDPAGYDLARGNAKIHDRRPPNNG